MLELGALSDFPIRIDSHPFVVREVTPETLVNYSASADAGWCPASAVSA